MNGNPCQILVDTGVTLPTLHPTLEPLDGTVRKLAEVGEGRLACLILCPENCLSLLPIAMGGGILCTLPGNASCTQGQGGRVQYCQHTYCFSQLKPDKVFERIF